MKWNYLLGKRVPRIKTSAPWLHAQNDKTQSNNSTYSNLQLLIKSNHRSRVMTSGSCCRYIASKRMTNTSNHVVTYADIMDTFKSCAEGFNITLAATYDKFRALSKQTSSYSLTQLSMHAGKNEFKLKNKKPLLWSKLKYMFVKYAMWKSLLCGHGASHGGQCWATTEENIFQKQARCEGSSSPAALPTGCGISDNFGMSTCKTSAGWNPDNSTAKINNYANCMTFFNSFCAEMKCAMYLLMCIKGTYPTLSYFEGVDLVFTHFGHSDQNNCNGPKVITSGHRKLFGGAASWVCSAWNRVSSG